jgi:hypothetical protein
VCRLSCYWAAHAWSYIRTTIGLRMCTSSSMAKSDEFVAASRRARQRSAVGPTVIGAHYSRRARRIVLVLNTGLQIAFSPEHAQGLRAAKALDLSEIVISPSGLGLHFPRLDADLYVPTLLDGLMGSPRWMAAHFGRIGGKAVSSAKAAAARRNGKLGGRPRNTATR